MNLSELQSVQSTERQADSLQRLRSTFYADAGEFISELRAERAAAVEAADDPFGDEEVRRLTDDIETARSTVEAIYERRVGKVVRMASLAAADMPTEQEGLTDEEAELFEELVDAIRANRRSVMEVVDAADGDADPDVTPPVTTEAASVDAAELMGAESESDGDHRDEAQSARTDDVPAGEDADAGPSPPPAEVTEVPPAEAAPGESDAPTAGDPAEGEEGADPDEAASDVPRTTVRITRDVGEIFGVDDRAYDLSADDVVTLPEANADPLIADDAAERLE